MEATLRTVVTKQAEWAEYAVQGVGTADMRLRLEADSAKGSNEARLRESQSVEGTLGEQGIEGGEDDKGHGRQTAGGDREMSCISLSVGDFVCRSSSTIILPAPTKRRYTSERKLLPCASRTRMEGEYRFLTTRLFTSPTPRERHKNRPKDAVFGGVDAPHRTCPSQSACCMHAPRGRVEGEKGIAYKRVYNRRAYGAAGGGGAPAGS